MSKRIPGLFETPDGKLVQPKRDPKAFKGKKSVVTEDGHYKVVFINVGSRLKFNPNPLNFRIGSRRTFDTCLVGGCGNRGNNESGICRFHTHPIKNQPKKMKSLDHFADWIGDIKVAGIRKPIRAPPHKDVTELLIGWMNRDSRTRTKVMDEFMDDALHSIAGEVKDSTTMQLEYEMGGNAPDEAVKLVGGLVDRHFGRIDDTIEWAGGKKRPALADVPVRILASILATGFAAEEANRGDFWFCRHVLGNEKKSHYASAYMSAVYYYVRRHTNATVTQARISTK